MDEKNGDRWISTIVDEKWMVMDEFHIFMMMLEMMLAMACWWWC